MLESAPRSVLGRMRAGIRGPARRRLHQRQRVWDIALLLGPDREQYAVAGGADLHVIVLADAEAVPAAQVTEPTAAQLELLGRVAQRAHQWGNIEI
jgi:hypothetical protein